jgi:hypothetical protein
MAKYKQEKTNSKNQPLKKRESTPPKREDDKVKQLAVMQLAAPVQRVTPRVSRWGPQFHLQSRCNGVPMEFGCRILWRRLCKANKDWVSLLVQS